MLKLLKSLIISFFLVSSAAWANNLDVKELNTLVVFVNKYFHEKGQNVEIKIIEDSGIDEKAKFDIKYLDSKKAEIQIIIPKNGTSFEKAKGINLVISLCYNQFGNTSQFIELLSNARTGDLASQHDLLLAEKNIKLNMLKFLRGEPHEDLFLESFTLDQGAQKKIELEIIQQEQLIKDLSHKINAQKRENKKKITSKQILDSLEAQEMKLNDLILKNDRRGVRKLLEAYLPFSLMSPSEKSFWNQWLEAIEHPNLQESIIGFRGLDSENDKVQVREVNGETKYGLMSTMLIRNQGSYTRRLRSLVTAQERLNANNQSEGYLSTGIMAGARRHAENPQGSTYLSFTVSVPTALSFANNGIAMVRVDRRRALFNGASPFSAEKEILIPLIIFPDEVLFLRQWPVNKLSHQTPQGILDFNEFIENPKINKSVYSLYEKFNEYAFEDLKLLKAPFDQGSNNKMCKSVFF